MKRIDASPEGLVDLRWSADGRWITYVRGAQLVCLTDVTTGEIREIGPGAWPNITKESSVLLERDNEIVEVSASGTRTVVGLGEVVPNTPKRGPVLGPDGAAFVFSIHNVFDKQSQSRNAYPYRHFLGVGSLKGRAPALTTQTWYGGTADWFADGRRFTHHEFDSTGGARAHVVDASGRQEAAAFGLYPSPSPDGTRIACRPRGGGSVVVYTAKNGAWGKEAVETAVFRIPESDGRPSANPPAWLDNRLMLVDEGGAVFRIDTRKDEPELMKKLPPPTVRGARTMTLSPSRELVAIETPIEEGFELRIAEVR